MKETEPQSHLAALRHCELIKGCGEDDRVSLVPFDHGAIGVGFDPEGIGMGWDIGLVPANAESLIFSFVDVCGTKGQWVITRLTYAEAGGAPVVERDNRTSCLPPEGETLGRFVPLAVADKHQLRSLTCYQWRACAGISCIRQPM